MTAKAFELSQEIKSDIEKILSRYETKRAALLPVLNLMQEKFGLISPEMEEAAAQFLELPLMQVREVVSFYTLFRRKPEGKFHFKVCRNLSCTLLGAEKVLEHLKFRLGIKEGETTPDGRFSLCAVECLTACEIAPMMQLNEKYLGNLTKDSVDQLLKKL